MAHKVTPDGNIPAAGHVPAAGDAAVRNTEVLEELRTILDSQEFAGSERGRSLLVYLVENALNGGLDRLKERTIGVEIFGRDTAYDTGQDAIVRVSANSVRKRLQAHYAQHNGTSTVRITLPPGTYVPEFHRVVHTPAEAPQTPAPPPSRPALRAPEPARRRPWAWVATVSCLVVTCGILAYENHGLRTVQRLPRRLDLLPWTAFSGHADASVVLTDASFTLHKFFSHREMSLAEYSSLDWLHEMKDRAPSLLTLSAMPYTSVASAVTSAKISILLDRAGVTTFVRSARAMQIDDFKEDRPIVLLGSSPANPWVELIDDRLNFRPVLDLAHRFQVVVNRAPKAGESASYIPTAQDQKAGVAYAVVALLPNLANKGPVLLIAGTNATATQAAAEFLTDLKRLRAELAARGIAPGTSSQHFELLFRVDCMTTGASHSEVIAHRVAP